MTIHDYDRQRQHSVTTIAQAVILRTRAGELLAGTEQCGRETFTAAEQ